MNEVVYQIHGLASLQEDRDGSLGQSRIALWIRGVGEVEVKGDISDEQHDYLTKELLKSGLELMDDKKPYSLKG